MIAAGTHSRFLYVPVPAILFYMLLLFYLCLPFPVPVILPCVLLPASPCALFFVLYGRGTHTKWLRPTTFLQPFLYFMPHVFLLLMPVVI